MQIETESVGSTVETMRFVHGEQPVFYACLPMGSVGPGIKRCKTNGEDEKRRLVSSLCDHLAAKGNPLWKRYASHDRSVFPIRVLNGLLGKPHLLLGEYPGPAVSFSQSSDKLWAALCEDGFDIGIDVAESREFRDEYPFNRVFHPQELAHALKLAGDDLKKASALLWSIKEAFVKALGCAFHLVDPLQINIDRAEEAKDDNGVYGFSVGLSEKAGVRFPMAAAQSLCVRSFFLGKMWLSIALLQGRDPCSHEQRRFITRNPWRQRGN